MSDRSLYPLLSSSRKIFGCKNFTESKFDLKAAAIEAVTCENTSADLRQPNRQHIGTTGILSMRRHCIPTAADETPILVNAFVQGSLFSFFLLTVYDGVILEEFL